MWFSHNSTFYSAGDGNIHLNITSKEFDKEILNSIEPFVYEWTSQVGGSVSAEHGIGFKKRNALHFCKTPTAIQLMHQIKKVMDPNGILNPYKVLPWENVQSENYEELSYCGIE